MIKKYVVVLGLALASASYAKPLKNFDEVSHAVEHGEDINVVMFLNKCLSDTAPTEELVLRLKPSSMMVIKNKAVAFSNFHFTTHSSAGIDKPMYESTRMTLNSNNRFDLQTTLLTPQSFEQVAAPYKAECQLDHGVKMYAMPPKP
jgi:hypothetical protein